MDSKAALASLPGVAVDLGGTCTPALDTAADNDSVAGAGLGT